MKPRNSNDCTCKQPEADEIFSPRPAPKFQQGRRELVVSGRWKRGRKMLKITHQMAVRGVTPIDE